MHRSVVERSLALCLLVGTLCLAAGGIAHPMLPADVSGQLAVMAASSHWRAIHLLMATGTALVIVGVWVRVVEAPNHRVAYAGALAILCLGLAANATNVLFMADTGTMDAAHYAAGDASSAIHFVTAHQSTLVLAASGNTLVALSCLTLAALEWRDRPHARWFAGLAAVAGAGGLVGVILFDPNSRGNVAAIALLTGWSLATALWALRPSLSV